MFYQGSAAKGSLSKEDAALICVEALNAIPQTSLMFEVRKVIIILLLTAIVFVFIVRNHHLKRLKCDER